MFRNNCSNKNELKLMGRYLCPLVKFIISLNFETTIELKWTKVMNNQLLTIKMKFRITKSRLLNNNMRKTNNNLITITLNLWLLPMIFFKFLKNIVKFAKKKVNQMKLLPQGKDLKNLELLMKTVKEKF